MQFPFWMFAGDAGKRLSQVRLRFATADGSHADDDRIAVGQVWRRCISGEKRMVTLNDFSSRQRKLARDPLPVSFGHADFRLQLSVDHGAAEQGEILVEI